MTLGQSKLRLHLDGANIDWKNGTVKDVTFPTLSKSLSAVLSKARSSRPDQMMSMLQMGCNTAKAGSATSILSKLASIHMVQKPLATNLHLGNFQIAKVNNLYADTSLLDSSAYMEQYNMDTLQRLVNEQVNYKS